MNNKKHNFLSVLFYLILIGLVSLNFSGCKHKVVPEPEKPTEETDNKKDDSDTKKEDTDTKPDEGDKKPGENVPKDKYSISYQSNHGIIPESIYVEKGTILTDSLLPEIELKGEEKSYMDVSFGGWQIDGIPVYAEDAYEVKSNIVLTAVWMVTINYYVGGEGTTGADVKIIDGYEWEDPENFLLISKKIPEDSYLTEAYLMELTGCKNYWDTEYEFKGWMFKEDYLKATTDFRVNKSTINLLALFDVPFTECVFTSAYGKSPVTKYILARPFPFEFSRVYFELTNDRNNFKGWKLKGTSDSEIISKVYIFPEVSDITDPDNFKLEFEAVWEEKQVTLTMYPNTSSDATANPVQPKISYGTLAYLPDVPSSWKYENPNESSKVYRFEGWTLTPYSPDDSNAEIVYKNQEKVLMTEDVTLYAYWVTDRLLPVNCNYPSGKILTGKKIELSTNNAEEVKIYYTLDGRDPTEASNQYDPDIGIVLRDAGELQKIKARAYPKDAESNKSASACSSFLFTVVWGLTLDKNTPSGAQVSGENLSVQIPFGQTYNIPRVIYSCRGYNLLGFAKKQNAEVPDYKLDSEVEFTKENTTLYAVWEKIYYTVSYSIGSAGYFAPDSIRVPEGYELTAADLPNITSEFYKFLGWIDSNRSIVKKGYKINSNTELCAKWEALKCKITYDVGPYTVTRPSVKEVAYKSPMENSYLPDLSINGYWFDGWYIDETETYYETVAGKDTAKSHVVSVKVNEGDFIINNDITLHAKAHKKYSVMDEVKDDNDKLVAIIIKASTQNEVAVGVGVKDYFLPYNNIDNSGVNEYYINTRTSEAQKFFFDAYIPEIIAYKDLSGDQDGSDNFNIILQHMAANGINDENGKNRWTIDQRLYDESPAFYYAEHYASNEDTKTTDDRTDVYCETYTKYNDNWYIPSVYEISLFIKAQKANGLYSKLKAEGKGFDKVDFNNNCYYIASSNLNPRINVQQNGAQGFTTMMAYYIQNGDAEVSSIYKCRPTPTYNSSWWYRYPTQFIYMRKFED